MVAIPVSSSLPALASWTQALAPSAIQDLLVRASHPSITSFALGLPAPELFPAAAIQDALTGVFAQSGQTLQYGPPLGALKRDIVGLMARRGVACTEQQIVLTTGAQQGLSLLARLLINPGQQVMIEQLAYSGFRQILDQFEPQLLRIPCSPEHGMDLHVLEQMLAGGVRPALIYTVSEGHNPLGISMSADRRMRLVELAQAYKVPIIEDDPYGLLNYDTAALPALRAHSADWVYYVGSFSKILAPAVRVGWLVVPEVLVAKLEVIKESTDLNTASLGQRVVAAYLSTGVLDEHVQVLRQTYRERRDAMVHALHHSVGERARWCVPTSGMFIWLELARQHDTTALLQRAIDHERIAFLPGRAFAAPDDERAARSMRLNFSHVPPESIRAGIGRLGALLAYADAAGTVSEGEHA